MSFVLTLIREKNCTGSYNYPYYQSCDDDCISSNIQGVSVKNLFRENSRTNRNARAMKTLFSTFIGLGQHYLFKNDTVDSVFLQFFSTVILRAPTNRLSLLNYRSSPSELVLRNMQQIYRRTTMPKKSNFAMGALL